MTDQQQTIAFHTLGCKLNYSETSTLSRRLEEDGFAKADFTGVADVYVINTCSVTDNADKECRYLVRAIRRRAPESTVVITGCYAQLKPEEIARMEGVDLVLGAAEKFNLGHHLRAYRETGGSTAVHCGDIGALSGFHASYSVDERTRTFLKVQDGCDYSCSFCTIPLARGHSRSDTVAGVLRKAEEVAAQGAKEIVLTGINLGDFGKHNGETSSFFDLIQALESVDGIERFRISSIEPNLLTEEIIAFVAASRKFMPHFHIPLQSGSNAVLGAMRRRYRRELYADRIAQVSSLLPFCGIGADVIVGFPGEDDAAFGETYAFLESLPVSYLHVFTYSERDNTLAAGMKPVVPVHVRNERNKALRQLSYQKQQAFVSAQRGTTRPVLWERGGKGTLMEGLTDNYIRVQAPRDPALAGTITDWIV